MLANLNDGKIFLEYIHFDSYKTPKVLQMAVL